MSDQENGQNTEAAPSLDQQLHEMQQALDAAKAEKAAAEANVANTQSRVDALSALLADIAKTKSAYEADFPALRAKEVACREYLSNETKCLEKVLEGKTEEIGRTVASCHDKVAAAEKAATEAQTKLDEMKRARTDADTARSAAKTKLETLKNLSTAIKARLNTLETIKTEVKKAHDNSDYAVAYWLLILSKRFQDTLDESPGIIRPEDLPDELQAAWGEVRKADDAYAKADADVKAQEAAVTASGDALKEIRQKLDATIRGKLGAMNSQQPKAA